MMKRIKNIVFDLGKVLYDFRYDRLLAFLKENGADTSDSNTLLHAVDGIRYEHGQIGSEEFISNVEKIIPNPVKRKDIIYYWQNVFYAEDEMIKYSQELRQNYPVYILSNTNELHWKFLLEKYEIDKLADKLITSYEVGAMKPNIEIYRAAEKKFGILAEESVFIDDKLENVEGAIEAGWHGVHHVGIEETKSKLEGML